MQTWMTSYDTIYSEPGVPLVDLKKRGMAGDDPRMLFSWYSGEFCTDPAFAGLPPEQRANPSMASWPQDLHRTTKKAPADIEVPAFALEPTRCDRRCVL